MESPSPTLKRDYWCSWWTDEDHPEASFTWWKTGTKHDAPHTSCVAAVFANNETEAADIVRAVFTDAVGNGRFSEVMPCDYPPASRYYPTGLAARAEGVNGQWWPVE